MAEDGLCALTQNEPAKLRDRAGQSEWSMSDDGDPILVCRAQLELARREHEAFRREGSKSMIEFSRQLISSLEDQLARLNAKADAV